MSYTLYVWVTISLKTIGKWTLHTTKVRSLMSNTLYVRVTISLKTIGKWTLHTTKVRRHNVLAGARGSKAATKSHTLIFLQYIKITF
jgi:hypothetical protein